jgi:hypothetical protein
VDALDLSPTDIAAGLALVRGAQKEVERERVQVGALCARAGGPPVACCGGAIRHAACTACEVCSAGGGCVPPAGARAAALSVCVCRFHAHALPRAIPFTPHALPRTPVVGAGDSSSRSVGTLSVFSGSDGSERGSGEQERAPGARPTDAVSVASHYCRYALGVYGPLVYVRARALDDGDVCVCVLGNVVLQMSQHPCSCCCTLPAVACGLCCTCQRSSRVVGDRCLCGQVCVRCCCIMRAIRACALSGAGRTGTSGGCQE